MDILDLQVCCGFLNDDEWRFATKERTDGTIVIKPVDYTRR
jgi:hypothetical protein